MNIMVNKLKLLINKAWNHKIWFALGFIAIILIISAILRALTPQPPAEEILIETSYKYSPQITFTSSFSFNIPKSLSLFSASIITDQFSKIVEVNKFLQFDPIPHLTNTWLSPEKNKSLVLEQQYISYKEFTEETTPIENKITQEEALQIVLGFLQSIGYESDTFSTKTALPVNLSGEGWEILSQDTTEFYDGYYFQLENLESGLPLIHSENTLYPIEAYVTRDGRIAALFISPSIQITEILETYSPLSIEKIKQNIQNGQVTYLQVGGIDEYEVYPETLPRVVFHSGDLQYRFNPQNNIVTPYVFLKGIGRDADGNEYNVEAITPAIEVQ